MLADLDRLMNERGIAALIVPMHESMHPSFRWLSRGAKVTKGYAVKPAGQPPLLVTYPMEREEAAATGLEVHLVHEYDQQRLFETSPNTTVGYARFFTAVLNRCGVKGRIGILGSVPFHLYAGLDRALEEEGWEVFRPFGEDLIQLARKRKEEWEVDAIRSVGERTEKVVNKVRELLRACTIRGGEVLHDGRPLLLGDLKQLVSMEITRHGMIEDHETILSQGRDAGVPHSRGNAAAPVRPSLPIILDIFPADASTGYFFDLTRTFCVGPIPEELQTLHARVFEAFQRARDAMRPGQPASASQALVCDYFESFGYETLRSNPKTVAGYVHGLGHGVGLDIHEKPSFALNGVNKDLIETGDIVTIEPGLYFPDRELGIRIEDTFVVRENGPETLCRGSYGLEP